MPNTRNSTTFSSIGYTKYGAVTQIFIVLNISASKRSYIDLVSAFANIFTYLLIIVHIMSCFWIRNNYLDGIADFTQALRDSIYYVTTTATTVGYGDFLVSHSEKRNVASRYLYQMFTMLNGIVFSSIMFALVNKLMKGFEYISTKEAAEVRYLITQLVDFEDWFAVRIQTPNVEISNEYYKALRNYFLFSINLDFREAAYSDGFINLLGIKETNAIKDSLLVPFRAKYAEFFKKVSYDFGMELIFMAKPYL